ncbi:ABC transporter substrate-binding protein [Agromyces sp. SYSU T00194]|uniref:ABC transporter substrate-binding protein n=1 Tax=Agromyces chitinivorans TaxID=3158560 RepID=UPI003393EFEE
MRRLSLIGAVGLAALVLAGCTSADDTTDDASGGDGSAVATVEEFNAMSGDARHDALVAAAQEEGAVVFYSTAPGWQPVLDAFSDTYDIEVEVFNGRSETILQRVVQEYQAGLHAVDVFEDEASQLLAKEDGMTTTYVNDELTSQIPGYDDSLGFVPFRLSVPTFAWNTDLVDDDDIPETITDLADPKWDGLLTMDAGAWPWYAGMHDYLSEEEGWSDDEIEEFFTTLVDYSSPQGSSITMTELIVAGEYDAGTSVLSQVVDRTTARDAPITWTTEDGRYMKPLIVQPEGGVLMANAPHPAAAVLLIDFILSEGAQVLLDGGTFVPTAVQLPGGPLEHVAEEDLRLINPEYITTQYEEWADEYDALIRQQ